MRLICRLPILDTPLLAVIECRSIVFLYISLTLDWDFMTIVHIQVSGCTASPTFFIFLCNLQGTRWT